MIVMAKEPVPGRVKTRLCPPCSPAEAAALAEASLADTLAAVVGAARPAWRAVALAGRAGSWLPEGVAVVPQRGDGFDQRLAAACVDAGTPALVIGADTPQLTPACIDAAVVALERPGTDAVLGPADDGGYWCLGIGAGVAPAQVFGGVPMSRHDTGDHQLGRLRSLGLSVAMVPGLRDVDTIDDALAVAAASPSTRFAATLAGVVQAAALRP